MRNSKKYQSYSFLEIEKFDPFCAIVRQEMMSQAIQQKKLRRFPSIEGKNLEIYQPNGLEALMFRMPNLHSLKLILSSCLFHPFK